MRWTTPAAILLLAACSGGQDDETGPEASSAIGPLQKNGRPAAVEPPETGLDADLPETDVAAPAKPETATNAGGKAIPPAIRGRWALNAADCPKRPGTDLTALVIDAATLRFHESHGELARVRERDTTRIVADYKFSGEGEEWDRQMLLAVEDGGKTLVRRDYGEGAAAGPLRYTRCAG